MCYQNTSKLNPNFDPYVIKLIEIRTKCGFSNVLEVLLSSAFVSCGRLWSALVRFGRLRSALASLGPFWSTLIEILVWISCSEVGQISCPIWSLVWSDLIIWYDLVGCHQFGILDQISCSHFLFKFLDQISWSIFTITLCSAWFEFLSNLVELPVRSDLWSDLTWSFDLIWSDLIRSKILIAFLDRISCSSLLIKFLDPSFRSWYLFIQISSNFSFNFVGHPFRSVPFLFGSLFYRVQISCSNLLILLPIMCLFLLTLFLAPSMDIDGSWLVYIYIYI